MLGSQCLLGLLTEINYVHCVNTCFQSKMVCQTVSLGVLRYYKWTAGSDVFVFNYIISSKAVFAFSLINEGDCSLGFQFDWWISCTQNICHSASLWLQPGDGSGVIVHFPQCIAPIRIINTLKQVTSRQGRTN